MLNKILSVGIYRSSRDICRLSDKLKAITMVCFKPMKAWQQTEARLDIPAKDYYALKKVNFHETPNRKQIEIPCGRCLGCRLDHASMWATRITLEAKNWEKCCFITLTYNNPHLPLTKKGEMTLLKTDVQKFLKRLRYFEKGFESWKNPITGKEENPIRYFACGEYGPRGGRPHYHLAVFNWIPEDLKKYKQNKHGDWGYTSKKLQEIWGNGFCVIEELNFNTANYIARYVQKKAGIDGEHREYTGELSRTYEVDERFPNETRIWEKWHNKQKKNTYPQEKEFIVMSRGVGIGRLYWEEHKNEIKKNSGVFLKVKDKVKLKPIPRYFKKLWEQENWQEFYRWKYVQEKKGIQRKLEILSKVSMPDGTSNEVKWEFYLNTQHKILKDKARYLKRNEFI